MPLVRLFLKFITSIELFSQWVKNIDPTRATVGDVKQPGHFCRAFGSCGLWVGKITWALIFEVKEVLEGHSSGWCRGPCSHPLPGCQLLAVPALEGFGLASVEMRRSSAILGRGKGSVVSRCQRTGLFFCFHRLPELVRTF